MKSIRERIEEAIDTLDDFITEEEKDETGANALGILRDLLVYPQNFETLEDWERRMECAYPIQGPVWVLHYNMNEDTGSMENSWWTLHTLEDTQKFSCPARVVANLLGGKPTGLGEK